MHPRVVSTLGGYYHIWAWREVPWWWPPFWGCSIQLGPYFIPQHTLIDYLFLQKKFVCLYCILIVPGILGPKVGLIFHQNVLVIRFWAFCIDCLLDFQSNWPPFSLILDLFDPSFSQNLRSDWVQFCFMYWTQLAKMFVKYCPQRYLLWVLVWHTNLNATTHQCKRGFKMVLYFHLVLECNQAIDDRL